MIRSRIGIESQVISCLTLEATEVDHADGPGVATLMDNEGIPEQTHLPVNPSRAHLWADPLGIIPLAMADPLATH